MHPLDFSSMCVMEFDYLVETYGYSLVQRGTRIFGQGEKVVYRSRASQVEVNWIPRDKWVDIVFTRLENGREPTPSAGHSTTIQDYIAQSRDRRRAGEPPPGIPIGSVYYIDTILRFKAEEMTTGNAISVARCADLILDKILTEQGATPLAETPFYVSFRSLPDDLYGQVRHRADQLGTYAPDLLRGDFRISECRRVLWDRRHGRPRPAKPISPKVGDVFILPLVDGSYAAGCVVKTDITAADAHCVVAYLTDTVVNSASSDIELDLSSLLVPPFICSDDFWDVCCAQIVGHVRIEPGAIPGAHCFRDAAGRYIDEFCNEASSQSEMCGAFGPVSCAAVKAAVQRVRPR